MTEAWSKWAPAAEKSFLLNIIYSGMTFGIMLTNIAGGIIVSMFGWPIMFYSPAVLTLIWCALCPGFFQTNTVTNRPSKDIYSFKTLVLALLGI